MNAILPLHPIQWLGTTYKGILGPEQTGGGLSMYESICPPKSGPPRHIHHKEDEIFYVLSGAVKFCLGDQLSTIEQGGTTFVPRGIEHTFSVLGASSARMLTILTPGGFEGFFTEMADGDCKIPDDMSKIVAIGAKYNISFTGPPL